MRSESQLEENALEAYVYGYPIVLMETTRMSMMADGLQTNRFMTENAAPSHGVNIVVRPNLDTLYVTTWLDLSAEPIVMHVPDTGGKYYVTEFLDDWTNVFASVGSRTTGTAERDFLITGPGWHGAVPYRLPIVYAPANTVWVLGRMQTDGPRDYPLVNALLQGFLLAPLGYWARYGFSGVSNLVAKKPSQKSVAPKHAVEAMNAAVFFKIMAAAMAANPPAIEDADMNRKLAELGLTAGESFDYYALPYAIQQALANAAARGPGVIGAESQSYFSSGLINGWNMPVKNLGSYGTDYMLRAIVAMNFLGANVPEDSVYGVAFADAAGKPLTGNEKYRIHMDAGQFPPVNAFWSITLYDADGFLVENPIHRHAISPHLGNLAYNQDGSLDILIQNEAPDAAHFQDWLPAPTGSFNLMLRMYWPMPALLNGQWAPPPVVRAGS